MFPASSSELRELHNALRANISYQMDSLLGSASTFENYWGGGRPTTPKSLILQKCVYSIEIQCHKRFHLKPNAAVNYTEISSLICKTISIFNEHKRKEG